jgi:dihydroxyacid dehydratase/phosphogluconate dehydratase
LGGSWRSIAYPVREQEPPKREAFFVQASEQNWARNQEDAVGTVVGTVMRSDVVKLGIERAPHRALLRALGCTDRELHQPFVGVINSYSEAIPGHAGLRQIASAVKAGIRMAGGTPFESNTIGVCDGLAMNHTGMKYSLASRELIADSVEVVARAHIVTRSSLAC